MIRKYLIYQGYSVVKYNDIRNQLDKNKIKYKGYVLDTASGEKGFPITYFFFPVLSLAPRAFRGTRNIKGECLKTYLIYIGKKDVHCAEGILKMVGV